MILCHSIVTIIPRVSRCREESGPSTTTPTSGGMYSALWPLPFPRPLVMMPIPLLTVVAMNTTHRVRKEAMEGTKFKAEWKFLNTT